jgi:hypothetical protein
MSREVLFAQWIAENHFIMIDISDNVGEWWSESYDGRYTTIQLFDMYLKESNAS